MKKIFTILGVTAVSLVSAQNLLSNPGFEAGLAPWAAGTTASYTAPTIATTGAHTGTNSAMYVATATTGFYQNVPVTGGKTYVISFWYKSAGDDTDSRLWSVYKNSGGVAVYTTADASTDAFRTNNVYMPSAAAWTKYTAEMPAAADAVSLDVAIRVYNGGTASFDDFIAADKANMAVSDVAGFDKAVQFNTVIKDQITFKLPVKSTVNIYSVDGKLISSDRVENGGSVNTQSLVKGAYIITVDNGANKISRKAIKN
ncbi:T9SS type A sorting domain-containing protein [Epilithonimonas sp. UC225_85]|uniref:T9SS type A sorting domain-containing protein n=1 Tax=Epilithonimonas sp. UC225_85 TaxID=3350167 RepID=UPI0036D3B326